MFESHQEIVEAFLKVFRGGKRSSVPGKQPLPTVDRFIHKGELVFFKSTNVGAARYYKDKKLLLIEYLNKSGGFSGAYLFEDVNESEAFGLVTAPSKGVWCWDHLRVRGSKSLHQKKFSKIR